jgi:hypothetical protein
MERIRLFRRVLSRAGLPLLVGVLVIVELLSATAQTTRRSLPLTAPGKRQVSTAWCPRQFSVPLPLSWFLRILVVVAKTAQVDDYCPRAVWELETFRADVLECIGERHQ